MIQVFERGDGSGAVYSLLNPITRSVVRFTEPFYFQTADQLETFYRAFAAYCDAAWVGENRGDPLVVDAYRVWAGDAEYSRDMAHSLTRRIDELLAEYGHWAVAKAAMDRVDHSTIKSYLEGKE